MKKSITVIIVILLAAIAAGAVLLRMNSTKNDLSEKADQPISEPVQEEKTDDQMTETAAPQLDDPVVIEVPDDGELTGAENKSEAESESDPAGTSSPQNENNQEKTESSAYVWTEWDSFLALSPAEQDAFMKSFESPDAFASWMVAAQAEWAAAHPTEEMPADGVITIGD